jgi:hypothetical protein
MPQQTKVTKRIKTISPRLKKESIKRVKAKATPKPRAIVTSKRDIFG